MSRSSLRSASKLVARLAFGVVALATVSQPARAYPQFVRHGYSNCVTCHQAPRGGGLLTEYGRGIDGSFSLISEDYKPGESAFQKAVTANGAIDYGAQVRHLFLKRENKELDDFFMQSDFMTAVHVKNARADVTIGIPPDRSKKADEGFFDSLILRRALVSYRHEDKLEIAAGRDFLPIGLNFDNHTAWVRERNRRNVTDFPTQLKLEYWNDDYELTPFVYLPSWRETVPNREKGLGLRGEYHLDERDTLGASALYGNAQAIDRLNVAVFSKLSRELYGLLLEYDYTNRSLSSGFNIAFPQHAAYAMPFFGPYEWIDLGWVGEYLNVSTPFVEEAWRTGPSINFRLQRFVTVILDGRYESRKTGSETMVYAQLVGAAL